MLQNPKVCKRLLQDFAKNGGHAAKQNVVNILGKDPMFQTKMKLLTFRKSGNVANLEMCSTFQNYLDIKSKKSR